MNMEFLRRLPIPKDIKEQYPLDEKLNNVYSGQSSSIDNPIEYYPSHNSMDNNGYIVCGMYEKLLENTDCYSVLKGRAYLQDIIAILDNKLLACRKVYIVDNRLYYPKYGSDTFNNIPKLFISSQKFE